MGPDTGDQIQVTGGSGPDALGALAGQSDALAVDDAGGNGDLVGTVLAAGQLDRPAASAIRLLDRQIQVGLLVGSGDRSAGPATAEPLTDQVLPGGIVDVAADTDSRAAAESRSGSARTPPIWARALLPGGPAASATAGGGGRAAGSVRDVPVLPEVRAETVVAGTILRIGQHAVGLAEFLELLLGPGFGADVGVVFTGQFAVGPLDVVGTRPSGYAQDVVQVVGHGG